MEPAEGWNANFPRVMRADPKLEPSPIWDFSPISMLVSPLPGRRGAAISPMCKE
jgi:hypothetical protein